MAKKRERATKKQNIATGGGGADEAADPNQPIDSDSEKILQCSEGESLEERLERLRQELPEGYDIICLDDVIDFSDFTPPAPTTEPAPPPLGPFTGGRIVFEADKLWHDDPPAFPKPLPLPPLPSLSMFPSVSGSDAKSVGKRIRHDIFMLTNTALYATGPEDRNLAGRAVANVVDALLDSWPEKETYRNCVSPTIRRIKKGNEGFKQRWNRELHVKGVQKQRTGFQKQLERFVRDGEMRLDFLTREVIHALFGGEPPVAKKEAMILAKWAVSIPGVRRLVTQARTSFRWLECGFQIQHLIDQAKYQDVPGYFRNVFRPVLENGLWTKQTNLTAEKFGDHAQVMQTILRTEIYRDAS